MDIRLKTCIIIRKNGEYLVGREIITGATRWSTSRFEAYRTRDREKARELARATGGRQMLFNPVADQIRVL